MRDYHEYVDAFADEAMPLAFVDRDALDANVATVEARAGDVPVRIASKSVRCRWVLAYLLDASDRFEGVMCYDGREAAHLAAHGFDDLLVAYPVWGREELRAVCEAVADGTTVTCTVDDAAQVARAASVARETGVTLPLCLDVDMSTEHLGLFFGVRRSPVRTPSDALAVAAAVDDHDGVELVGVLGYEAQIAGVPDRTPARNPVTNALVRLLKRRSKRAFAGRRGAVVDALEDAGHDLRFVNGGGTGSVESTVRDPAVTEVTVGSGFYWPALFDHYDGLDHEPAAGYAVEVTRTPAPDVYTCRGGGYVASGPPAADRAPVPTLPEGASLRSTEGAGEVQTPVAYDGPVDLAHGDPVVFRHAKAGELCRTFDELHVVGDDGVERTVPTYRGDGVCYL
jgi:D-serine deaminase-like pyridoxal phosphate-dependent protein